ncbi:alpha/beta fold hydrolase [Tritonibacter horizontis]|uniref:Alpha/beta hydrolase family protein n=1 Tax=Tritonibacter horizontis TaxID=1768241 RepID=A0A132C0T6_9RHOB|nr:alpha/beta fold hydrolase [Tritonibacter horizontis]KUP94173.1 alpha/beta hydrolase family protein [Tritonibacter horizontis]
MRSFPDLSSVDINAATDGLLTQMFVVRNSEPKPWEQTLSDPAQSTELSDGSWAHVWGEEGRPVLLAHGYEGRYSQFAPVITRLGAAGFKAIALEMPGHGRAGALRADPLLSSQAVQAASAKFGPFHAMIGHSQGGNAVMHAAANGVASDRLVLIAPLVSVEARLRLVCALVKLSAEGTELFLQKMSELVGVHPSDFEGATLQASLPQPALIVHDTGDREIPFAEAKELAAAWPSARLLTTNDLGHKRLLADAKTVEAVCEFVTHT